MVTAAIATTAEEAAGQSFVILEIGAEGLRVT